MKIFRTKEEKRTRRQNRIRARVSGTAERPRISIHRSLNHVFLQLINDEKGLVVASVHTKTLPAGEAEGYKGKSARAYLAGQALAKTAVAAGVKDVVFDRSGYAYHGRIKAAAEGARSGGLNF